MEIFTLSTLLAFLAMSRTARAENITISQPEYQKLINFPSASVIAGTPINWAPFKKGQPGALFLWKGPPDNFTMLFQISNIYKQTGVDNNGNYNWVVSGIPYSGKDYVIELRIAGVSSWSDYFELFNQEYPDPNGGGAVPSVKNIGPYAAKATSKGTASSPGATGGAGAATTDGASGGSSDGTSSSSGPGNGNKKSESSGTFTTAALAGAIAASVIGTALICTIVFLLISRRRKQQPPVQYAQTYPPPPPPAAVQPPPVSQTPKPVNATQLEAIPYKPPATPMSTHHYQPPAAQLEANQFKAPEEQVQMQQNNGMQQYGYEMPGNQHRVELHGHGMQY